jgi:predicted nucleotidyltransferase
MTEEWEEYKSILREAREQGSYQNWAKNQNKKFKAATIDKGEQSNTAPYVKSRPMNPKSGLGPLEEAESLVPEIKEDLNRDIWNEDNKIKPKIAVKLLRIAEDFYRKLDIPADILNITLTGSMANYNWTDKSDLDLHIVIDYSAVDENVELVEKYLSEAKTNWNRNHDIKIKGHEVEVYVQNINEPHHSTGVYSILDNDWLIVPEPAEFEVSEDAIEQKYKSIQDTIKMIEKLQKEKKYEEVYGDTDRLKSKIRNYRQSGLETGGEFSVENLVFKALRNGGELETLSDLKRDAYDSMMSISEVERKK